MAQRRPHVVVMPVPTRGHVNPMLHFSKLLATQGIAITFVNSEYNTKLVARSNSSAADSAPLATPATTFDHFCFEELPDGLPPHLDRTTYVLDLCETMVRSMAAPFEALLARLLDSDLPPTCVLADTWMTFAVDAAIKFGIPHANFWTQSAASFASLLMISNGSYKPTEHGEYPLIPGAEYLKEVDMNTFARCYDVTDYMFRFVTGGFDCFNKSRWIFINTFEELEKKTLDALKKEDEHLGTALHAIGPLLPPSHLSGQYSCNNEPGEHTPKDTLWAEEEECLTWLNNFEPKSVLYVSFGSLALMSAQQIEELALGLEESGYPFLWVTRPDLIYGQSHNFNKAYLERVKDIAYFVSWAPQLKVLSHKSIGGFFTHAGWNSTLESIAAGVPMLCWPYFSDQPMDCKCIEQGWNVGLRLQEQEDKLMNVMVPRTTVVARIKALMSSDAFHKRAHEWSSLAMKAALRGGSSFNSIMYFVESLKVLA